MTGKNKIDGRVDSTIDFREEKIVVKQKIKYPSKCLEKVEHGGKFKAIHMASSGYFIPQIIELPTKSNIVEWELD